MDELHRNCSPKEIPNGVEHVLHGRRLRLLAKNVPTLNRKECYALVNNVPTLGGKECYAVGVVLIKY